MRRRLHLAVRTLRRFLTYVASYVGFGLVMYAFLTQRSAPGRPDTTTYWVLNLVGWMLVALGLYGGLKHGRQGIVYLSRRRETPGFWTRNRDALVVNLIVAVVSVLLGVVATLLATSN